MSNVDSGNSMYKTEKTPKIKSQIAIIALLIILSIVCFVLMGCDPGSYSFNREELSDVVKIELINYDNPDQDSFFSWVPDHSSDLKSFDNSKMTILENLGENKISDFLDDLCEYDVLDTYYAYDSPKGICIKLSYPNGDFMIIWGDYLHKSFDGYIGKFYSDGEVAEFIGCFSSYSSYESLVNDYFQTQI